MSNLIVLLITAGTAFPAGWLLCRAWSNASKDGEFAGEAKISRDQHHAMLQAQRSRYRRQVQGVAKLVRRHEAARDKLREKLTAIDEQTDAQAQENARLQEELKASRESLAAELAKTEQQLERIKQVEHELGLMQIERDELRARSKRRQDTPADAETKRETDEQASNRAERGELREKLATAEHRQRELENRLQDRDLRIEELQQTVESWKHRVAPLAHQIQSYREAIQKLQRGDRRTTPAVDPAEEATTQTPKDELQRIRGIGPALERRLNAHGISSFQQIAGLDPLELVSLADRLAISARLPERDEWIRQARELAARDDMAAA